MKQKVIQIGNSLGVVIPMEIARQTGLRQGSSIFIEKDPSGNKITISDQEKIFDSSVTPEFLSIVERVNLRYGRAFKKLANLK